MSLRPFGARGGPPGTMGGAPSFGGVIGSIFGASLPIMPIPGIPGGTLLQHPGNGGTGARGAYPSHSGTGAVVDRATVRRWGANAHRGTGHAHMKGPVGVIHAGTRAPGVQSNVHLVQALVSTDIRNPAIAQHTLGGRMVAGSTRLGGFLERFRGVFAPPPMRPEDIYPDGRDLYGRRALDATSLDVKPRQY